MTVDIIDIKTETAALRRPLPTSAANEGFVAGTAAGDYWNLFVASWSELMIAIIEVLVKVQSLF